MNRGTRQIIAEKVASTVRVLELLGLDYSVGAAQEGESKGQQVTARDLSQDGVRWLVTYLQRRER
jgi:hypothetical protein